MILTARETLATKVQALDLGADDFLMKPFEQMELAARCRALIRRANLRSSGQLTLGRLRIDIAGRQLFIDGEPIELTGREWLVVECLALNSGRIVTKERLQQGDGELGPGCYSQRDRGTRFTGTRQIGRFGRAARRARTGVSIRRVAVSPP